MINIIEPSSQDETIFVNSDGEMAIYSNAQRYELKRDLREWRVNESQIIQLPAYCVFNDKTLYSIIEILPSTENMLWLVDGLAQEKIELYGKEIVELVSFFLKKHDVKKILYNKYVFTTNKQAMILSFLGVRGDFVVGSEKLTKHLKNKSPKPNEWKQWEKDDDVLLSTIYNNYTLTELAEKFGRSNDAIISRLVRLKIFQDKKTARLFLRQNK